MIVKILIIFTGGTIGSTLNGEYISLNEEKPYAILHKYNEEYPNDIEWHTMNPYTLLSENATVETYKLLAENVKKGLTGDYDGIIITHGSDTIQYSGAFLSLILGNDTIPVMLVCSNYVLEHENSNGMANFSLAVDCIVNKKDRGVLVPYDGILHRGENLMPHNLYSDKLYSLNTKLVIKPHKEPDYSRGNTGIMLIHMSPGLVYPTDFTGVKAVLLHAYHGGTLCVKDEGFISFTKRAKEKNIKIFMVGANPETEYDSCREYEELGINVMEHISPIYAYMKLWVC